MMLFRSLPRFRVRNSTFLLIIPVVLFAACTPYQSPEFLQNTSGAPITLYDQTYTGEGFSISYPSGWRVITPPADAPESVVLAGENCQIIYVSTVAVEPPSSPECPADQMRFETLAQDGIYIYGGTLTEQWDSFEPVLSQIAASLTPNNG